ncbi:hypothetical protein Bbelb_026750 [Branchiostoma belcheri]|nr:hypothetical protein Bbelb_026750 [Branchiostoma belcheri]
MSHPLKQTSPSWRFKSGTRPVAGQSPVLTRAACGRVLTGSYSSAGQLSGPWRVPGGIPTGSSRVFEQAGACSAAQRVPGSEVTASLRRISPNGARSDFNSELKLIRRPRGAKNRPATVGKPAGLRPDQTKSGPTAPERPPNLVGWARGRSVHSAMLVSLSGGPWPAGPNVLEFGIGSPKFTSLRRHQSQGSLLMLNGRWSTTAAPANTCLTVPGATSLDQAPYIGPTPIKKYSATSKSNCHLSNVLPASALRHGDKQAPADPAGGGA